jgi:polyisoprenoid-binding protein YceI
MTASLGVVRVHAGTWTVSASRTRVTFTVRNLGRTVLGSVACTGGEVLVDEAGAPVRARATLDLNSLDTGIPKRDADLRTPRLLDIDRAPVMTWSADRFSSRDGGGWAGAGHLSVRGASAPLVVSGGPEAVEGEELRIRASAVLDRTAVGIRAPRLLIGRIIGIEIDAWLRRA